MDINGPAPLLSTAPMVDPFGRTITYLRLSVTDRCDFRCVYCMSEHMAFLPKRDLLTLEELGRLSEVFMDRGVRKIRLTGGEPLVRRGIMELIATLGKQVEAGRLDELTLTTNGSQLYRFADQLFEAGVRRLNVSLDTLDADRFASITRWGRLAQVLEGIEAARNAGLKIKINTVALKGINDTEIPSMIEWAHGLGMDFTAIEVMPLGEAVENRLDNFLSLTELRETLSETWTLDDLPDRTGGPATYVHIKETGGRMGFITPLTHNFCGGCNRVRISCTGQLFTCLGQTGSSELRAPLRASAENTLLNQAINAAIATKPKGHDFAIDGDTMKGGIGRHMSHTGG